MGKKPSEKDIDTSNSFANFYADQHRIANINGPLTTSASRYGVPQYAVTSFSLSDILQGTFAVKDPKDDLLLINKALTQNLDGMYQAGLSSLSSFNTTPSIALDIKNANSNGGGGPGSGNEESNQVDSATGEVKKEWVASLPLEHPEKKLLIWNRQGKCSREMHLPVADGIENDIAQHKQHKDMPPQWQHPWDMDRVGGWIGGQDYTSGPLDTGTIGGEDANTPGHTGAFGLLTPEDEQYYISMAWPYKGAEKSFVEANRQDIADIAATLNKSDYKGKRILVYSVKTKKACVCTPGDWGPFPKWSNGTVTNRGINGSYAGLAPDVHWVLGTDHGDEFMLGWMADTTPLGPYKPAAGQSTSKSAIAEISINGASNEVPKTGEGTKVSDFINIALANRGKKYVFNTGSITDPDPASFDCSGLVYYCAMRAGYKTPSGVESDWSYSATIISMMESAGTTLDIDVALLTPGAIIVRKPQPGKSGHVVISMGDNKVIEARSDKDNVGIYSGTNRPWTHAGWLPGMIFDILNTTTPQSSSMLKRI